MSKNLDLKVVLAARDKITGPLKKVNATTTGTARALKKAQAETKKLQSSQRDISSFKRLDGALAKNSQALNESQERVRRLGHELRTTTKPTAKLRAEYNRARKDVDAFTQKGQDQRKELGKMRKRLSDAGVDVRNLSAEEKRLAEQMKATNTRIQRQKRHLERLGNADVSGKFNNMSGEIASAGRQMAIGGAAIGGALGLISHGYAQSAEETDQWAARLGLATSELGKWHYLGRQFGVDSDAMTDALKELSLRTDEFAVTGKGPAAEAFDRLGLGQKELAAASGDTGKLMDMVLARMRSIENVAARQRLADELFGGSGGEQLAEVASLSAKEIAAVRSEAEQLGVTVSGKGAKAARAYMKEWRRIQAGFEGVRNTIGSALMPVFTEAMGDIMTWLKSNQKQVKAFADELAEGFRQALPVIRDLASGIASGVKTIASLTSSLATLVGGFDNLGMILAFVFAMKPIMAMLAFGKAIFTAGSAIVGLAGGLPAVAAGIKSIGVALTANPIGLIIAAIAGAGYLIYKNWGAIMDFFKGLPAKFSGFGSMIMDGLVGGLLGGLKKVKDTITNAGKATIGWFKDTLGIKSPSRVFMGAGQDTLEGYRQGIKKQEPEALKQVSGFGRQVRRVGAGIAIGASALPAAAGVQFDNRPPIATGTGGTASAGESVTINVYGAPGQNEQEIAAQVERILQERDRRKATRARSALYDRE